MALRQMGIARMGNYRPKFDAINAGGKTGRPKLLHNGSNGNGITGGGGLNAKGTGGGIKVDKSMRPMQRQLRKSKYQANKHNAMKINEREKNRVKRNEAKTRTTGGTRMNPHPTGSFMYGNNQWGSINKLGKVDWTAQKPMAGKPVIGFNQALPWLQRTPHMRTQAQQFLKKRAAKPAFYADPIMGSEKAQLQLGHNRGLSDIQHAEKQNEFDYTTSLDNLKRDYGENVAVSNSAIGAAGMADSGVASAQLGDLASKLLATELENKRQRDLQVTDASRQTGLVQSEFDVGVQQAELMARERWAATHQGMKAPAVRKPGQQWKEGGFNYRMNAQGIPMTYNQPKPAAPKFKSFRTFTNGAGQVVPKGGM